MILEDLAMVFQDLAKNFPRSTHGFDISLARTCQDIFKSCHGFSGSCQELSKIKP
jgi:hypothetical protein